MSHKLYVGNIPFQVRDDELGALFAEAGRVESVRIITDWESGRSRGFGFVEMATSEEAQRAKEMLNGKAFRNRDLVVNDARPPRPRAAGVGSSGRGSRQETP